MLVVDSSVEHLLKNCGLKVTPQRAAVLGFLDGYDGHPTVEDVYDSVLQKFPSISLATIYNTLEKLSDTGVIHRLSIDGERAHYESKNLAHGHFLCKQCGTITDIQFCKPLKSLLNTKHRVEEEHGYFKGVCVACLENK